MTLGAVVYRCFKKEHSHNAQGYAMQNMETVHFSKRIMVFPLGFLKMKEN